MPCWLNVHVPLFGSLSFRLTFPPDVISVRNTSHTPLTGFTPAAFRAFRVPSVTRFRKARDAPRDIYIPA
jgi:hypothetical protein